MNVNVSMVYIISCEISTQEICVLDLLPLNISDTDDLKRIKIFSLKNLLIN